MKNLDFSIVPFMAIVSPKCRVYSLTILEICGKSLFDFLMHINEDNKVEGVNIKLFYMFSVSLFINREEDSDEREDS